MPFWPFVRKERKEQLSPAELQERLIAAAWAGPSQLRRFCKLYRQEIETSAASLTKAPPGFDADPAQVNRFVQGLGTAAQYLATECGSPALWAALTGSPESNPLNRWQEFLQSMPARLQRLEHDALRSELLELIEETRRFRGDSALQNEAFFHGRLGEVCFHSGRIAEAAPAMERALELCRTINDQEGVAVYLGNLAEIARYNGQTGRAIQLHEQLRDQWQRLGRPADAARSAREIELLRAEVPLCRVVLREGDRTFELHELKPVQDKHFQFEFVRNCPQLQKAIVLTRQGSELAEAGQLTDALERFAAAAEVDPYDPEPHYQSGVALMELGAYAQAKESFAEVERLAPGWFRCRADRWLAEQLESGAMPAEAWTILRSLEDGGLPKSEIEPWCEQALERFPGFAALWLALGDCRRDRGANPEAEEAYRQGLSVAQEPDIESRLLCALSGVMPPGTPERKALVARALALKGSLVAQAVACFLKD